MMVNRNICFFFLIVLIGCSGPEEKQKLVIEDLAPWCIRGFDSEKRTPKQRVELIKKLGLKKYGYNKGDNQVEELLEEFKIAAENNIEITSVFFWLNADKDSLGKLSDANHEILKLLGEVEQKPAIWLSFNENFFEGKSNDSSLQVAVEMVRYIKGLTDSNGNQLALYNHHGWFGNPYNQLKILEQLEDESVSIVFNFHHAQDFVNDFDAIAHALVSRLSFVNVSGVKKDGPQIVTVGKGEFEFDMINTLFKNGYKGPWGVLGHVKDEDVELVLKRNIKGIQKYNQLKLEN